MKGYVDLWRKLLAEQPGVRRYWPRWDCTLYESWLWDCRN
jgi:hypothetical protein